MKSLVLFSCFFALLVSLDFCKLEASYGRWGAYNQGAWGGNGGWWGDSRGDWYGEEGPNEGINAPNFHFQDNYYPGYSQDSYYNNEYPYSGQYQGFPY